MDTQEVPQRSVYRQTWAGTPLDSDALYQIRNFMFCKLMSLEGSSVTLWRRHPRRRTTAISDIHDTEGGVATIKRMNSERSPLNNSRSCPIGLNVSTDGEPT